MQRWFLEINKKFLQSIDPELLLAEEKRVSAAETPVSVTKTPTKGKGKGNIKEKTKAKKKMEVETDSTTWASRRTGTVHE